MKKGDFTQEKAIEALNWLDEMAKNNPAVISNDDGEAEKVGQAYDFLFAILSTYTKYERKNK